MCPPRTGHGGPPRAPSGAPGGLFRRDPKPFEQPSVLRPADPLDPKVVPKEIIGDAETAGLLDHHPVGLHLSPTVDVADFPVEEIGPPLPLLDMAELVVDVHEEHDRRAGAQVLEADDDTVHVGDDRIPAGGSPRGKFERGDVHPQIGLDDLDAGLLEEPLAPGGVRLDPLGDRKLVKPREPLQQRVTTGFERALDPELLGNIGIRGRRTGGSGRHSLRASGPVDNGAARKTQSGDGHGPEVPRRVETSRSIFPGLRIGHATDARRGTGVTVACIDRAALTVASLRGGASATFDTGSLSLDATFGRRWAVFFAGGSLFGLDAARGIRTALLEAGAGAPVFGSTRRIVPITGAALYDLPPAGAELPDYAELGGAAVRSARPSRCPEGRVGAGAGATVGKYRGREHAMRGGVGFAAGTTPDGARLAVLVAVNAVGAVRDPVRGGWLAGARTRAGRIVPPGAMSRSTGAGVGTTLALVVTDAPMRRPELLRVVTIAEGGLASVICPYGSATDGDVTFGVTTASTDPPPGPSHRMADALGVCASELARRAVRSAMVRSNPDA